MIRGTLFGRFFLEVVDMLRVRGASGSLPCVRRLFSTVVREVRKYKTEDLSAVQAIAIQNMFRLIGDLVESPLRSFDRQIAPLLDDDTCFVSVEEGEVRGFASAFVVDPAFKTLWKKYGLVSLLAVDE